MTSIPALHARLEGFTSSFRLPLIISGTQISAPVPSYSNLLGMISACAGRIVKPRDTRIGFEFHCISHSLEIERKDRLSFEAGRLKPFTKTKAPKDYRLHLETGSEASNAFIEVVNQGIGLRQVYWYPRLDLYLTDLNLKRSFEIPAATPCFGRSQDVAWIVFIQEIELVSRAKGRIGPTLIPLPQTGMSGLVVRLPEWMNNSTMGRSREPGPFGIYLAVVPTTSVPFMIERENLYHPSDAKEDNQVIYLHEWMEEQQ